MVRSVETNVTFIQTNLLFKSQTTRLVCIMCLMPEHRANSIHSTNTLISYVEVWSDSSSSSTPDRKQSEPLVQRSNNKRAETRLILKLMIIKPMREQSILH